MAETVDPLKQVLSKSTARFIERRADRRTVELQKLANQLLPERPPVRPPASTFEAFRVSEVDPNMFRRFLEGFQGARERFGSKFKIQDINYVPAHAGATAQLGTPGWRGLLTTPALKTEEGAVRWPMALQQADLGFSPTAFKNRAVQDPRAAELLSGWDRPAWSHAGVTWTPEFVGAHEAGHGIFSRAIHRAEVPQPFALPTIWRNPTREEAFKYLAEELQAPSVAQWRKAVGDYAADYLAEEELKALRVATGREVAAPWKAYATSLYNEMWPWQEVAAETVGQAVAGSPPKGIAPTTERVISALDQLRFNELGAARTGLPVGVLAAVAGGALANQLLGNPVGKLAKKINPFD